MGDQVNWRRSLRGGALRLLTGLLVLWVSATLSFTALQSMPGDAALAVLGEGNPTPETLAAFRAEHGLDQPLFVQYARYLRHLCTGNLGVSYSQHLPVSRLLAEHAGATLQLTLAALLVAWGLVLTGTLLTAGRRGWVREASSLWETMAASLPPFWLAIILLGVFSFELRLLPPAGNAGLRSLILPSMALAIPLAGFIGQVTREAMEIALEQPFVLSARARGMSDAAIRVRHVLRHSALPGLALSGWALGALISGAVVVEIIFSRKGLGRQLYYAVQQRDLPLVLGITLFVALVYVVASIIVDFVYPLVDPRLRKEES